MQETRVRSLGQKDPGRREWQPTPGFLPGQFHGQRNLAGYSPQGLEESEMTEEPSKQASKLFHVTTEGPSLLLHRSFTIFALLVYIKLAKEKKHGQVPVGSSLRASPGSVTHHFDHTPSASTQAHGHP